MTSTQQKLNELHEELADIYRQSPYVTVKTTHTENLWRRINELEYEN